MVISPGRLIKFPYLICLLAGFLFSLFIPVGLSGQEKTARAAIPVTVFSVEQGLEQSTVYQVLQDDRGLIWVVTGGGLQCFDGTRFRTFDLLPPSSSPGTGIKIIAMASFGEGEMILSSGEFLFHFDSRNGSMTPLEHREKTYFWLFTTKYLEKPLCWSSPGNLYLAGEKRLYPLKLVFNPGEELPEGFYPWDIKKTTEESFQITGKGGYLEMRPRDSLFDARWIPEENMKPMAEGMRFITREGRKTDTLRPVVRSIFEDRYGNTWYATDGNGLLLSSSSREMFDVARIGFTRCMAHFNGEIWAGTFQKGLYRLSPGLDTVTRVNPAVFDDKLYILDLTSDNLNRLWIATDRGLYVVDRKGSVLYKKLFTTKTANFLSIPGDNLLLSAYDKLYRCSTGETPGMDFIRNQTNVREVLLYGNSWWVGNHFGLYRRDASAPGIDALWFMKDDHLSQVPVYSILPVDSLVWAGTERGIACFTLSGKPIGLPAYLQPLSREFVYSLAEDLQHRIWFAGNKGIGCIPASRDRVIRFSSGNNLQSLEFNSNALLTIPSGRIYFGGIEGVNGIRTDEFRQKTTAPDVRLFSLEISDTAFSRGIPSDSMTVEIRWQQPHFSGSVFSPDYLPQGSSFFSFFLEGFETAWSRPAADNKFSYRGLPPGNYRLWARCIDPFNKEGKPVLVVSLIIRPPFWKTGWFIIPAAILLVILIILAVRKRQEVKYTNLLREMEQRNAIDRERLRISQDMHDEIGSSLTQIAILSEIVKQQDGDPEARNKTVSKISGISGKVVDEMSDIIWAMNPRNDNLASFVSYLRRHASEYLSTAGIEARLHFPGDCPAVPMTSEQRRNLYLVVKEALHNIVRHSGAENVKMNLTWNGRSLDFLIEDDGKGFDPEAVSLSGNGMTTMRKRMEAIGGKYSIVSGPGKGTTIRFAVQLSLS